MVLRDSLHPIPDEMGHEIGGFLLFRRFRIMHMLKPKCHEAYRRYRSGHDVKDISDHYLVFTAESPEMLAEAERVGMGFVVKVSKKRPLEQSYMEYIEYKWLIERNVSR
ncbi:MAG TPA: hypothetical protein VGF61_15555 [Candidatus Acidoferrum sp.]|jgi:hypothetical protein